MSPETDERRNGGSAARAPWSLRTRLLAVSLTILLAFVAMTGLALDRAFRESADAAQRERLQALLYLLMGTLEVSPDGTLSVPLPLPEPRLSIPGSGLYAQVVGPTIWRSESALGAEVPFGPPLAPGEQKLALQTSAAGHFQTAAQGVLWAIGENPVPLSLHLAAPLASTGIEVQAYRKSLWSALAVMAFLLLCALVLVQRWGLRPLRVLAQRLATLEAGEASRLGGPYPRELAPLADNLERLLQREREVLERHRKALGDLAHSLKTPLAILRGAAPDQDLVAVVGEQTRRMDDIVHYHLQRAATAGASRSAPPLALGQLVERLFASLAKVHSGRRIGFSRELPDALQARIDEGDAIELLGNVLDNACKWAASKVMVSGARSGGGLVLTVEDDGPGIEDPERLMQRGQRGDERVPGHGIGLALAQDIALAYRGDLRIDRSPTLGGARIRIWLGEC